MIDIKANVYLIWIFNVEFSVLTSNVLFTWKLYHTASQHIYVISISIDFIFTWTSLSFANSIMCVGMNKRKRKRKEISLLLFMLIDWVKLGSISKQNNKFKNTNWIYWKNNAVFRLHHSPYIEKNQTSILILH